MARVRGTRLAMRGQGGFPMGVPAFGPIGQDEIAGEHDREEPRYDHGAKAKGELDQGFFPVEEEPTAHEGQGKNGEIGGGDARTGGRSQRHRDGESDDGGRVDADEQAGDKHERSVGRIRLLADEGLEGDGYDHDSAQGDGYAVAHETGGARAESERLDEQTAAEGGAAEIDPVQPEVEDLRPMVRPVVGDRAEADLFPVKHPARGEQEEEGGGELEPIDDHAVRGGGRLGVGGVAEENRGGSDCFAPPQHLKDAIAALQALYIAETSI